MKFVLTLLFSTSFLMPAAFAQKAPVTTMGWLCEAKCPGDKSAKHETKQKCGAIGETSVKAAENLKNVFVGSSSDPKGCKGCDFLGGNCVGPTGMSLRVSSVYTVENEAPTDTEKQAR